MKRLLLGASAILLLHSCSSGPGKPVSADPPALPVLTVALKEAITYQQYPAAVKGIDNVEIRPQVSGTLDEVYVDEGAFVRAGTPLFKINQAAFNVALDNAKASLHAAEGAAINADLEVEKTGPLVESKVYSDYQLKNVKANAQVARGNVEQARAAINVAKINLGYTIIKAPVSGLIGRLLRKKGSLVGPADEQPLTELSDVHQVHVYFAMAETDFAKFKSVYPGATLGQKLKVMPPVSLILSDNAVYGEAGKIDMIDGQFNENTGAITLRATFPNVNAELRSGNTGKIKLGLSHSNTISIPQSATVELQNKIYVFALADSNKVKKQFITIAGKSGKDYLVDSGLKAGDRIVTDGIGVLQDGMVIHPKSLDNSTSSILKK